MAKPAQGRKPTQKDLDQYRALLRRLLKELAGDISELEADAFSTDLSHGSVDNPADSGSDSFSQEFSLELLRRDESIVEQIQSALERLDDGSYGRCAGCESWIPKARLTAVPYTQNCVECQRDVEQAG